MPIHGQCPGCGRKFQAPDKLSGKRLKCPNCSAVISVGSGHPAASAQEAARTPTPSEGRQAEKAQWYAQTADGEQLGPMSKEGLDRLVAEGRLDGFCRIRREDWQQWKWAEAVYPQFALPAESETQPAAVSPQVSSQPAAATAEHRLRACPDCDKMISRRASQCPSCGCPLDTPEDQAVATEAAGPPTGETSAAAASSPETGARKRKLAALLVAGTVAVALLICVVVVAVGWQLLGKGSALLNRYGDDVRSLAAPPPAPPKEPVAAESPQAEEPATPEEIRRCMEEAAAAAARQVDEAYRQVHLARSLLDRTEQNMDLLMDLLPSLAEGDLDNLPEPKPEPEPAAEADDGSYRSQYQPLYDECLAYLRENTPAGALDRSQVRELANRWADGKLGPLEKQLQEQLGL